MARIHISELDKLTAEDIKTLLGYEELSLSLSAEPEQIELLRSAYAYWARKDMSQESAKDDFQKYCDLRIAGFVIPSHPQWRLVTMDQAEAMSDYEIMNSNLRGNQKIWLVAGEDERAELLKVHAEWFGVTAPEIQEVILEVDGDPECVSNWDLYAGNRINGATSSRSVATSIGM